MIDTDTAIARTGPSMNKGKSKQDYVTPMLFTIACQARWGNLAFDLAATNENTRCGQWITPEMDSLKQNWSLLFPGLHWCNPPYGDIEPWAKKACAERGQGCRLLLLVPASVGANWWARWVHYKSHVFFLNGRITFEGCADPYPRDLAVCLYDKNYPVGYSVWRWQPGRNSNPSH